MRGLIYIIKCNITNDVYIGSTRQKLYKRISRHKYCSNETSAKKIIIRNNYNVYQLEKIECENVKEIYQREQHYIDEYKNKNEYNVLNKNYSFTTKEDILKRKVRIVECECGNKVTRNHLMRHKNSNKHHKLISVQKV